MGIIFGGNVIPTDPDQTGVKPRIYKTEGVPTDTTIGFDGIPPNGTLATNVLTSFVYERQLAVWTRIDTL